MNYIFWVNDYIFDAISFCHWLKLVNKFDLRWFNGLINGDNKRSSLSTYLLVLNNLDGEIIRPLTNSFLKSKQLLRNPQFWNHHILVEESQSIKSSQENRGFETGQNPITFSHIILVKKNSKKRLFLLSMECNSC